MVRITFLIESLSVAWGLPWCVSCVLLWAGCQEPELSARDRAVQDALEICVQRKLASLQQSEPQIERQPILRY